MNGTNTGKIRTAVTENELAVSARYDRNAFAELYERYFDKVYTYVFYRSGNQASTEDIVSETFLRALQHIDTFQPRDGGFGAWLLRIARNRMIDHRRQEGQLLPLPETVADQVTSPEQRVIDAETGEALRRLVAALPPEQNDAVILKYAMGMKNRDIARVMGKSETAISSLLHRALQNLRGEVKA